MVVGDQFCSEWRTEARTGYRLRRYRGGDRSWDVALAVPEDVPAEGCALLVVTDGALHFDAVAGAARALARRTAKTGVGPTIVAGIASGIDWSHDADRRADELVPGGAGADALLAMVRALVADIPAMVPVASGARAMFGHSLGGLFALHALTAADDLFDAAVAISPSVWRAPDLPERVGRATGAGARIWVASGELEPGITPALPAACAALGTGGAGVTRAVLAGEDHGSVVFAALPAALRFLHRAER